MKVTVFKNYLNGERVAVSSVEDLAEAVRRGDYADAVSDYRCASPDMLVARSNGETVNRAVRMAATPAPMIWLGGNVKAETIKVPVCADRVAPTLCRVMRIRSPNGCNSQPLEL